jgi:hypothetical protein
VPSGTSGGRVGNNAGTFVDEYDAKPRPTNVRARIKSDQVSFVAQSPETLRQRYGQPVSETFLVRPGIVVSASYGASGQTCELVIAPKQPDTISPKPDARPIDDKVLEEIGDELVPKSERGKYIIATFLDIICLPENNCAGVEENYQKLVIYRKAGEKGSHYETIRWKRTECDQN